MLRIPIFQKQSADFTERVTLDNVEILLRFSWNTKSEYWMINTYQEVESGRVINGVKVVSNYPLFYQFPMALSGQILIFLQDSSLGSEITYDSLGAGHNLFYLSAAEFDIWKDANGF